jgi:thioredoxin-dependent peroxiredoxin
MKLKKYFFFFVIAFLIVNVSVSAQNPTDFKLVSATDNSRFVLSKAKGKYVALHFLLKTECPFCIKQTKDYMAKSKGLPNVIQVYIKPDEKKDILAWYTKLSADSKASDIPIYMDPDAKLANEFNVPNGYSFHNQIVHFPALILLGPDGKEVFRYIGKNNTDRYSFEQLTTKMQELSKR